MAKLSVAAYTAMGESDNVNDYQFSFSYQNNMLVYAYVQWHSFKTFIYLRLHHTLFGIMLIPTRVTPNNNEIN